MISQYAPDVGLQVELYRQILLKRRQQPPCQPISSQIYPQHSKHTPAAPLHSSYSCKFPSLSPILLFTHTVWLRSQSCYSSIKGPCGSGAALSNACVLFDPILDFKGRHLIPTLGEVGAVGGGWAWGRTVGREYNVCNRWVSVESWSPLPFFSFSLPLLSPEDLLSTDR